MAETVRLVGETQRAYAAKLTATVPTGWVVKFAPETRRDKQNRKLHAMIADIQRDVPEMAPYNADDIRLRFLNALGVEMRFLPALEGQGAFPVGLRSSTLTVEQFSALVDLLHEYGARKNVRWTAKEG